MVVTFVTTIAAIERGKTKIFLVEVNGGGDRMGEVRPTFVVKCRWDFAFFRHLAPSFRVNGIHVFRTAGD
jgi:hypothetical protein